ncbi:hybrid sensor histidine kinase/response regulator [Acinetobacter sp. ANC 4910]|uniref:Hpt domain-containing protein n=1 Tax=Acinetobacter sp. ANC 4910 TaxID=2529850 RepID=UPI001039FC56|nr:Hpt domain-containing protein [Acinetobacter sp. ANC 4910]TCB37425.1 hybrid sensor histidine kinase/response regulator [Acinetobacter sp. ANC 4910]
MKEILKNLVDTTTLPEDSYLEQDAEILEIFVEEIEEIFEELDTVFEQWLANPSDQDTLTTIRRHFHTLKGSGRMVGAKSAGEVAWAVEDTLNRVIFGSVPLELKIQKFAETVYRVFQFKLYPQFKSVKPIEIDLRPLVLLGQELQQGRSIEPALEELLSLADQLRSSDDLTGLELDAAQADIVLVEEELSAESSDLQEVTTSIFIEEAEEHLATIDHFLKQEAGEVPDYNGLIRALHTLRGSSSMAHIQQIFDASSKVENLFKTLLQEEIVSTSNETALLIQYAEFVRDFLHILRQGKVENLSQIDQTFNQAWENYGFNQEEFESSANPQGLVSQLIELDIDLLLDAELEFEKRIKNEFPTYVEQLSQKASLLAEHTNNRASQGIHDFIQILDKCYQTLLAKPTLLNIDYAYELFAQAHQEFIYLFDTLAAGQRISLSAPVEQVLQNLTAFVQQDLEIFDSVEDTLSEENTSEPEADLTTESGHQVAAVNFATLSKRLHSDAKLVDVDEANRQFDEDLLDIFLEEADELLMGMDQDVHTWSSDQSNTAALNNLMRYLHTLKGGANMIQATHIGLIAHELETIYERIINQQIQASPALIQIVRLVQDNIADRIQTIREEKVDYPAPEAIDILNNIQALVAGSVVSTDTEVVKEQKLPVVEHVVAYEATTIEPPAIQPVRTEVSSFEEEPETSDWVEPVSQSNIVEPSLQVESLALDESVRSIVEETFYEEAAEIFDTMEKLLRNWSEQRSDRSLLLQLQRAAHSLKGGARMAEIEPVGAIAYRLESAFEQFAVHHFNSNVYDPLLQTTITWLRHAIFDHDYTNFDSLKAGLEAIEYADVTVQLPSRNNSSHTQITAPSFEFIQGDGAEPPAMMGEWESFGANDQSNEMIRISADLIEKMIDLSGENSINRSRIEMDLGQLGNTLNEMELAIKRLADQLRRMEGELESQIIAKHGSEVGRYADFDPLEMDQYSSLNQLSKSLAESASDLVDFKSTLAEKIRDTEGLLLQQSRIQAEIQEGLMRTRLVPFSRLLPRLQRIVRQTASTLNRPAELIVNNTEGELDRTILERLVTPLEHMLRNAVDHGIEDPAQRQSANKPEIGKIELNISRQGTDVVVEFHDDGKGIDVNRIKEKAISLGLMKADQSLEKEEILQFIFHPGFSTAQQITQISGRGVGLDVVQSSIKALGGHVTVDSILGKGTSFSIRVPTTVAVSDALMVKSGDQQFALPLAHIERIVRIAPATLETYFNSKEDYFKIDNQSYKLRYISEFVSNQPLPRLSSIAHSLPVLLIKGNSGQTIALLVDQLIGSRAQIVVKPIGQQFAAIGAIAGATILGDGQVCLILDGQNIARQVQTTQRVKHGHDQREYRYSDTRRLIMIVDDSVTVRKVTSRLLERQGYDVVTAKDGVDAIEQLENVKPDLMLLDIEMPRMDGFEVTNLIRHHEVHKQLPIIMITSRTGEKHRERAFSLGVTHYMGKPFQEAELLNNIESLLTVKQG